MKSFERPDAFNERVDVFNERVTKSFERVDVFNERVTKSFERVDVSNERFTKSFERVDVSNERGVSVRCGPDTCGWRMRMGKCGWKNADNKKMRITKKVREQKNEKCGWQKKK